MGFHTCVSGNQTTLLFFGVGCLRLQVENKQTYSGSPMLSQHSFRLNKGYECVCSIHIQKSTKTSQTLLHLPFLDITQHKHPNSYSKNIPCSLFFLITCFLRKKKKKKHETKRLKKQQPTNLGFLRLQIDASSLRPSLAAATRPPRAFLEAPRWSCRARTTEAQPSLAAFFFFF